MIRAIGTQFNVYRRAESTMLSVLEGVVEVVTDRGSSRLQSGEEAQVSAGAVVPAEEMDVARTASWRQHRLVFDLDPLADVATEFNRYNRAARIRVESEAARAKRFSGVFDMDDPKSIVELLATYADLMVERRDNEIVVHARTQ